MHHLFFFFYPKHTFQEMKKTSASVCVYIWGLEQVVDAMGAVFGLIIVYGRRISPDFQHELMRTLFKKAISTDNTQVLPTNLMFSPHTPVLVFRLPIATVAGGFLTSTSPAMYAPPAVDSLVRRRRKTVPVSIIIFQPINSILNQKSTNAVNK